MASAERSEPFETFDILPPDEQSSVVAPSLRGGPDVVPLRETSSSKKGTAQYLAEVVASAPDTGRVKVVRPEYQVKKSCEWEAITQSWEGRVVFDDKDSQEFVAVIKDLTCRSNPDEEVVIGYESVLNSDRDLIADGAVFFWNIGSSRKYLSSGKLGPSKHKYEIRFRRLPPISPQKLAEIRKHSKELSERLHGNHSA